MSPALVAQRLSWTYAGATECALHEVSLELAAGSWTLVTGPTGSGKSTLLWALAGLAGRITRGQLEGRVSVEGRDVHTCRPAELANLAGLVLQLPDDQLCTASVEAEVAFGCANLGMAAEEIDRRVHDSLARWGLLNARGWHPQRLSGGQRQRLLLAALGALRPRVLVLDEPLSQLDGPSSRQLLDELDVLRAQGWTIVMSEHRLDEATARADRLLVLERGRLQADCPLTGGESAWCQALLRAGLAVPQLTELALRVGQPPWRSVASFRSGLSDEPASATGAREVTDRAAAFGPTCAAPSVERDASQGRQPIGDRHMLPLVLLDDLGHGYSAGASLVWRNLTGILWAGQSLALVGPNGAGKSTLLWVLAGTTAPSLGRILEGPGRSISRAMILQNPDLMLSGATVRDELAWGPRHRGGSAAEVGQWVETVASQFRLQEHLEKPPLSLSQGQRLRAAVAAVLGLAPCLLLADEPTTGQDPDQVDRVLGGLVDYVRREPRERTLVFSTHDLSRVLRWADRVWVLAEGRLAADCTPSELLADDGLLSLAGMRRPPLWQLRHELGLQGTTVEALAQELMP